MAESYSVRAILSAQDRGFTSTLKSALGATNSLQRKVSGFAFGMLTGAGQQAFAMLTNGVSEFVGEFGEASAAWKTFEGNMKILGKTEKEINSVKKTLQDYATETIYSASDMATTYSQLAAVGIKSADKLVTGFGGLAAAAENPQQAMKTLSQQATQMAAKPKVAWQDFKLMLEQTPAGIAAVAKEMGMSTSEMVKKIQAGEIKTEDFFKAIEKVGNADFADLAKQYKTLGQAMDGAKETLSNKLLPAYEIFQSKAIGAVSGVIDKMDELDGEKIAGNMGKFLENAAKYWDAFKESFSGVWKEITEAGSAIKKSIEEITGGFGSTQSVESFADVMDIVAGAIKKLANFIEEHSDAIGKLITMLPKIWLAMQGFKIAQKVAPFVSLFAKGIGQLAAKGIGAIAAKLFGIAAGEKAAGTASQASAGQVMTAAKSFLLMSTAVLLIAAGFALLAQSAIALAAAGPLAIGVMVGLIAAIALLAYGASVIGPALTAGAVGFIAFGAAILMVGAGILLASAGMALLATQLPVIAAYGLQAALSIAALGAGMIVFAAGALLAGAAMIVLGAGLIVAAAGLIVAGAAALVAAAGITALAAGALLLGAALLITAAGVTMIAGVLPAAASGALAAAGGFTALLGVALLLASALLLLSVPLLLISATALIAGAGMIVFGAGMIVGAAGTVLMAGALKLVNSSMKSISKNAKSSQKSLKSMQKSVKTVSAGLDALGSKAKSAMKSLISAFDNTASKAKNAGKKVGTGFSDGVKTGMNNAKAAALSGTVAVAARLRAGRPAAYSAGAYISKGFAAGMLSCLAVIRSAATKMAAQAEKAIRAKAKIHSPSKVTTALGEYFGEGFANGISEMYSKVQSVSERLVNIPAITTPDIAMAYGGELSSDYNYTGNQEYSFTIPFNIDGREFAKAEAAYMQDELNKKENRESRKRGKR